MSGPTHAGAVVYRGTANMLEFLLVAATKNPDEWVLPKGHIETGELPVAAAVREVFEETGVRIEIIDPDRPLGTSAYRTDHEDVRAIFFLGRSIAEQPASEPRDKAWLRFERAETSLPHSESKALLRQAMQRLQTNATGGRAS